MIYPNPSSDFVTISCKSFLVKSGKLAVTNIPGEKLVEQKLSENNYDVHIIISDWKKGIYFCTIEANEKIDTGKIVKE